MPLQVEYKEKYSAFGRFPGGFTKREGKASDYEILTSRLVDRALRPLFPDNYHAEVYVNIILFSADGEDLPDALAGLAASAALCQITSCGFRECDKLVRVASYPCGRHIDRIFLVGRLFFFHRLDIINDTVCQRRFAITTIFKFIRIELITIPVSYTHLTLPTNSRV